MKNKRSTKSTHYYNKGDNIGKSYKLLLERNMIDDIDYETKLTFQGFINAIGLVFLIFIGSISFMWFFGL